MFLTLLLQWSIGNYRTLLQTLLIINRVQSMEYIIIWLQTLLPQEIFSYLRDEIPWDSFISNITMEKLSQPKNPRVCKGPFTITRRENHNTEKPNNTNWHKKLLNRIGKRWSQKSLEVPSSWIMKVLNFLIFGKLKTFMCLDWRKVATRMIRVLSWMKLCIANFMEVFHLKKWNSVYRKLREIRHQGRTQ